MTSLGGLAPLLRVCPALPIIGHTAIDDDEAGREVDRQQSHVVVLDVCCCAGGGLMLLKRLRDGGLWFRAAEDTSESEACTKDGAYGFSSGTAAWPHVLARFAKRMLLVPLHVGRYPGHNSRPHGRCPVFRIKD